MRRGGEQLTKRNGTQREPRLEIGKKITTGAKGNRHARERINLKRWEEPQTVRKDGHQTVPPWQEKRQREDLLVSPHDLGMMVGQKNVLETQRPICKSMTSKALVERLNERGGGLPAMTIIASRVGSVVESAREKRGGGKWPGPRGLGRCIWVGFGAQGGRREQYYACGSQACLFQKKEDIS